MTLPYGKDDVILRLKIRAKSTVIDDVICNHNSGIKKRDLHVLHVLLICVFMYKKTFISKIKNFKKLKWFFVVVVFTSFLLYYSLAVNFHWILHRINSSYSDSTLEVS